MKKNKLVVKFFRSAFIISLIFSGIGVIYLSSLQSFHVHYIYLPLMSFIVGRAQFNYIGPMPGSMCHMPQTTNYIHSCEPESG